MKVEELPTERECLRCLKGTMYLQREYQLGELTLWYRCNNKCCMHEVEA
jgi:hypothetical protein